MEFKGLSYGNGHFTTLDGLSYEYNGIGEYWLIRSPALSVQARLVVAQNAAGSNVSASIFGAFAIQVPAGTGQTLSDRVHVEMTNNRMG